MKILVTGASGFIGCALTRELVSHGHKVKISTRKKDFEFTEFKESIEIFQLDDIKDEVNWSNILTNVECIVHCAGRAHILKEFEADALAAFRRVNVDGTKRLAEQAAASGVKRLIYLSSVGVFGDNSNCRPPFSVADEAAPVEDFAISKLEAERELWSVSVKTGLEVVVLRLPLVYGRGVKGNLARLFKFARYGWPLPIGSICNSRSYIGIENLISLIVCCLDHSEAAGEVFLASDDEDISTPELLRRFGRVNNVPVNLISIPLPLLGIFARIFGFQSELNRIAGSFKINSEYVTKKINWSPRVGLDDGLRKIVEKF